MSSESTTSAESRRRVFSFINTSSEWIPPFAVMMLVSDPEKRSKQPSKSLHEGLYHDDKHKASLFGTTVENDYVAFVDKCDLVGEIMQDSARFAFNTELSVPPGGRGCGSFGEFPVRAAQSAGSGFFHNTYFAVQRDNWYLQHSGSFGAFRFMGVLDKENLVWVCPNLTQDYHVGARGTFATEGVETVDLDTTASSLNLWPSLEGQFFEVDPTITVKTPGAYALRYGGTASAIDPGVSDTILPFAVEAEFQYKGKPLVIQPYNIDSLVAAGNLIKVPSGYEGYWPTQKFEGFCVFRVDDVPVQIRLKQTDSEKVRTTGEWALTFSRYASLGGVGLVHFTNRWYHGYFYW